jgi:hypothetical protein
MARILRDYKCQEHGFFEGFEPTCPQGCTDELVLQVFLKSPGFVSDKSKAADSHLRNLASEFGMSDIKSTREGENQSGYLKRNNKFSEKEYAEAEKYATPKKRGRPRKDSQVQPAPPPQQQEARAGDSAIWGGGYQGMNMQSVLSGQFARPVGPAFGKPPEITSLTPQAAGIQSGPRVDPRATMQDPQNLKIKT